MATLSKALVEIVIIFAFVNLFKCMKRTPKSEVFQNAARNCKNVADELYIFPAENILGEPWRVYYSWNIDLHNKCGDISFKNATASTIRRFYNDMGEYLDEQPEWGNATLKGNIGQHNREVLLIPNPNIGGRFTGVANVAMESSWTATKKSVPLLMFQIKLIDGKYLLFMDCHLGVGTLSVRTNNQVPYRADIEGVLARLPIKATGHHACVTERGKDEFVGELDFRSMMKDMQRRYK